MRPSTPELLATLGVDPVAAGPAEPMETLTVPLLAHGSHIGFLIVVRPRDHVRPHLDAMTHELARRAALAVAAARIYEERAALAGTLRAALLPPDLPTVPGVDLGARYRAAQEAPQIGGDFYQVYRCGADGCAFEIGDVCGKGVQATVLTGQVRQSLRTAALVEDDPARTRAHVSGPCEGTDPCAYYDRPQGRTFPLRAGPPSEDV